MHLWQRYLLNSINGDEVDNSLYNYIDDLLKWWGAYGVESTDTFNESIQQKYSVDELSRHVHRVFDVVLFADGRDCFFGSQVNEKSLKKRYRRLMQTYHPDRIVGDCRGQEEQFHKRAELINRKYSQYKKEINLSKKSLSSKSRLTASPIPQDIKFKSTQVVDLAPFEKLTSLTPDKLRWRVLSFLVLLSMSILTILYFDRGHESIAAIEAVTLFNTSGPQHAVLPASTSNNEISPLNKSKRLVAVEEISYLQREEVELFIKKWTQAWSSKDVKSYLSFYANDFVTGKGRNLSEWSASRGQALINKRYIRVQTIDLQLKKLEEGIEVKFMQYYFSDRWVDKVKKKLILKKYKEEWKIAFEQVNAV